MDYINKLEKYLGDKYDCLVKIGKQENKVQLNLVKIGENINNPDLELSEWYTADEYTVYVMTNDARNIDWENDVYYYEPSFDIIIDRIHETVDDMGFGGEVKIYMDTEQFLPEQDTLDWLEDKDGNQSINKSYTQTRRYCV